MTYTPSAEEVEDLIRDLPESFWDVEVWPRGNESYVAGSIDVAQRRRLVESILSAAHTARAEVVGEQIAQAIEEAGGRYSDPGLTATWTNAMGTAAHIARTFTTEETPK